MEEGGKGGVVRGGEGGLEDEGFMAGKDAAEVLKEQAAEEGDGKRERGEGGIEGTRRRGGGRMVGDEVGEGGIIMDEGGGDGGDCGEEAAVDKGGKGVTMGVGGEGLPLVEAIGLPHELERGALLDVSCGGEMVI